MPIVKDEKGNYVLKVGDSVKSVSEEELFTLAQKGFGADAKFEEAAKLRKETEGLVGEAVTKAQSAVRQEMASLVQKAQSGDLDSFGELLDLQGVSGAAKFQQMEAYREVWKAALEGEETPAATKPATSATKNRLTMEDMPVEFREELKELQTLKQEKRQRDATKVWEQVSFQIRNALDGDKILGTMVKNEGPKASKVLKLAQQAVQSRIRDGEEYGPRLLEAAVKEVREFVTELGPEETTPTPFTGLGGSPDFGHIEAQATEPIKPVNVTSEGYIGNVLGRMAQHIRKSIQSDANARPVEE